MRTHVLKTLAAGLVVLAMSFAATSAQAQNNANTVDKGDQIDGEIAGIVGLGLLGGEVGILLPPAFKLHDQAWAWVVFPLIGIGGGVGAGIALADGFDPKVNVALLASGMGLLIPAVVSSLAIKSRRQRQDMESASQPGSFRLGQVRFDAPTVSTAPTYSAAEQVRWGVAQRNGMRISLLSGHF